MKKLQKITIVCLLLANAYGSVEADSEPHVTNGTIEPNAIEHITENKIESELEKKIKKPKPKKNIIGEQKEGFWVKDIKQAGWSLVNGVIGIGLVCATYYYMVEHRR